MNQNDFDKMIHAALRAEPSREQLERLEDFWRQRSCAARRVRRIFIAAGCVATVAATILLCVTASIYFRQGEAERGALASHSQTPTDRETPDANCADATKDAAIAQASQSPPKDKSLSTGRQPTDYERLFFLAKTSGQTVAKRSAAAGKIDETIDRIAQDAKATVDAEQIIEDDALAVVDKIVGSEQLAQLAGQTNDAKVRAAIYKRLLNSGSEPALRGYLSLVRNKTLGGEALAAADAVSGELLETLLALLKDENEGVRLAAAMVLGHANGPEIEAALIEFVMEEPSSQVDARFSTEAWMAILSCRGRQTEEFIDFVMRQPKLLGHFNRARVRLAQMTL